MIAIVFASASGQTVHPVTRSMSYADITTASLQQSPLSLLCTMNIMDPWLVLKIVLVVGLTCGLHLTRLSERCRALNVMLMLQCCMKA